MIAKNTPYTIHTLGMFVIGDVHFEIRKGPEVKVQGVLYRDGRLRFHGPMLGASTWLRGRKELQEVFSLLDTSYHMYESEVDKRSTEMVGEL